MSHSWESEKEKERTLGFPLYLHPSSSLGFFVTGVATAVTLYGSMPSLGGQLAFLSSGNYFPAETVFGWPASVFPFCLARPPSRSLPGATGEGRGGQGKEQAGAAAGDREVES